MLARAHRAQARPKSEMSSEAPSLRADLFEKLINCSSMLACVLKFACSHVLARAEAGARRASLAS